MNKRQDYKTRFYFEKSLHDLKELFLCYDKEYHFIVCNNYLQTYNFNFNNTVKGRLFKELGLL